jgi:hypothetical protein
VATVGYSATVNLNVTVMATATVPSLQTDVTIHPTTVAGHASVPFPADIIWEMNQTVVQDPDTPTYDARVSTLVRPRRRTFDC